MVQEGQWLDWLASFQDTVWLGELESLIYVNSVSVWQHVRLSVPEICFSCCWDGGQLKHNAHANLTFWLFCVPVLRCLIFIYEKNMALFSDQSLNSSWKWGFSLKWKSKIAEKNIFRGEKNQVFFFLWKLRWWICECKLKVQNWHSSLILVC